jgi:hypothetical protein
MREMIQPIINFSRHDPAAAFGLLLIGGAGVLYFHIAIKMIRACALRFPGVANRLRD